MRDTLGPQARRDRQRGQDGEDAEDGDYLGVVVCGEVEAWGDCGRGHCERERG